MANKRSGGYDTKPPEKKRARIESASASTHSNTMVFEKQLPNLPTIEASLEKKVFTHQSQAGVEYRDNQDVSYERLEFLGDAYIEAMATRLIWDTYHNLPAGRLSQIRELLVKNETLGEFFVDYGFDQRLSVANAVRNSPKQWAKVKGDVFEAYVAAIILSDPQHGFRTAEEWLNLLWVPKLRNVVENAPSLKAKEDLAKMILARKTSLVYTDEKPMMQVRGGMQTHFIGVYFTGFGWERQHLGSGSGLSKVGAGNAAATQAMENKPLIDEIVEAKRIAMEEAKAEKEKAESGRGA